jgi:hypothetical protein
MWAVEPLKKKKMNLFICELFKDAVSGSEHIVLNDRMNNEY